MKALRALSSLDGDRYVSTNRLRCEIDRALRKQSIPRAQKLIGAFEGGEKDDEELG